MIKISNIAGTQQIATYSSTCGIQSVSLNDNPSWITGISIGPTNNILINVNQNNNSEGRQATIKFSYSIAGVQCSKYATIYQEPNINSKQHLDNSKFSWNKSSCNVQLGTSYILPVLTKSSELSNITYSSSNTSVARIGLNTGDINILRAGTTTISAKFPGNSKYYSKTVSYTLTVREAYKTVTLGVQGGSGFIFDGASITKYVGSYIYFNITADGANADEISYVVTGSDVMEYDSTNGKLSILNPGTATFTARVQEVENVHSGAILSFTVVAEQVVVQEKIKISVDNAPTNPKVGQIYTPIVRVTKEDGSTYTGAILNYSCANIDVQGAVSVVNNNSFRFNSEGHVSIMVSTQETAEHSAASWNSEFTIERAQKDQITIKIDNVPELATVGESFAPIVKIYKQGSDVEYQTDTEYSINVTEGISEYKNGRISFTGVGDVSIQIEIPEGATHYEASNNHIVRVTSAQEELYTVGLISDIHFHDTSNSPIVTNHSEGGNSSSSSEKNSLYEQDLEYLLNNPFRNVDFIASPGDISTYSLNDFARFTEIYNQFATNIPFYCSTGNHDHGLIYGSIGSAFYNGSSMIGSSTSGGRWTNINGNDCPGSLAKGTKTTFGTKGSYFIQKNGDVYVFLMLDYGSEYSGKEKSQVQPHNQLPQNYYTNKMMQDCGKTGIFSGSESNFNFQYYNPFDLVYLGELIRNNSNKRIFVFSHHFFTNKSGNNKNYHPGGSTCLMGLTLYYLNWLNDTYSNVIWFTGHSHISWTDTTSGVIHWTNIKYGVNTTNISQYNNLILNGGITGEHYWDNMWNITGFYDSNKSNVGNRNGDDVYYRVQTDSSQKGGWNVHLPSMSRPISTAGSNMNSGCEAAIMRVYSNKVEIEKLGYDYNSSRNEYNEYSNISEKTLTISLSNNNDAIVEPSIEVPVVECDYINISIKNTLSEPAYFTGRLEIALKNSSNQIVWLPLMFSQNTDIYYDNAYWDDNVKVINSGETFTQKYYKVPVYTRDGSKWKIPYTPTSINSYLGYTFATDNEANANLNGATAVRFFSAVLEEETVRTSNGEMYTINPISGQLTANGTYSFEITGKNSYSDITLVTSTVSENPYSDLGCEGKVEPTPTPIDPVNYGVNDDIWTYTKVKGLTENGNKRVNGHIRLYFTDESYVDSYRVGSNSDYNDRVNAFGPPNHGNEYGFDRQLVFASTFAQPDTIINGISENVRYLMPPGNAGMTCSSYSITSNYSLSLYNSKLGSCASSSEYDIIKNNFNHIRDNYWGKKKLSREYDGARVYYYDNNGNEQYYSGTLISAHRFNNELDREDTSENLLDTYSNTYLNGYGNTYGAEDLRSGVIYTVQI